MGTLGSYSTNFAKLWVQIKIYLLHISYKICFITKVKYIKIILLLLILNIIQMNHKYYIYTGTYIYIYLLHRRNDWK